MNEPNIEPVDDTPVEAEKPATAVLRAEDTVLQAHLARQASWEEDAKRIFKGPTAEELERRKLLDDLQMIEAAQKEEREKLTAEARERDTLARATAMSDEAKALRLRAKELETEARQIIASIKK